MEMTLNQQIKMKQFIKQFKITPSHRLCRIDQSFLQLKDSSIISKTNKQRAILRIHQILPRMISVVVLRISKFSKIQSNHFHLKVGVEEIMNKQKCRKLQQTMSKQTIRQNHRDTKKNMIVQKSQNQRENRKGEISINNFNIFLYQRLFAQN